MSVFAGGKPEPIFSLFFRFRWEVERAGGVGDNNGHVAVSRKECVVVRH